MKKIFINIQAKIDFFDENYEWAFLDIKSKYNLEIINFYIKGKISDNRIKELEQFGIKMLEYFNEEDLINKINNLNEEDINFYVNTYTENLIPITNEIKKILGKEISDYPELFRNKGLQRDLLLKYDNKLAIKYIVKKIKDLNYLDIKEKIGLPFILKPKDGVQSSGVVKIETLENFNNYISGLDKNLEILIEEFIDGEFYNINYFVNEKGKIFFTKPIREIVAIEYGIDDFFSPVRIISKDSINEIMNYDLLDFIKKSVKACGIKNTFVHQEFKLTSKKIIKNIELNGRIGGYRMEMYRLGYGINLLELMFNRDFYGKQIKNNIAGFTLYPNKNGILQKYNNELFERIKKLKSFYSYDIFPEEFEGKKIGLTKDGFKKVGKIRLSNINAKEFIEDYNFIKNNYKKLLILENTK